MVDERGFIRSLKFTLPDADAAGVAISYQDGFTFSVGICDESIVKMSRLRHGRALAALACGVCAPGPSVRGAARGPCVARERRRIIAAYY